MFNEVCDKYFNNFKSILPYIVVKTAFDLILLKLCFFNLNILTSKHYMFGQNNNNLISAANSNITMSFILYIAIAIFTEPLFGTYIRVILRKIISNEEINHRECFTEGFSYYWRFLGVTVIIALIFLAFIIPTIILGLIPFIGILLLIGVIVGIVYIGTIYSPCLEYLILNNSTISDALSNGTSVGKKYFWRILLLSFVVSLVQRVETNDKISSISIFVILTLIYLAVDSFAALYRMSLCKEYDSPETNWQS